MMIYNCTRKFFVAEKVIIANTMPKRMKGLLGREYLESNTCMLIIPCNSIHTFGMKFPIDVLFLDQDYRIIKIIENMQPWKNSSIIRGARSVVEMHARVENRGKWKVGDQLQLVDEKEYIKKS